MRALALLMPAVLLLASACQSILGIESWTKKPAGPDAGSACLRASDCAGTQVCLFQTCSEPCANDKDCQGDTYCLRATDGTACVTAAQAQCGDADCPAGTTCSGGRCLTSCAAAGAACPGGQECAADVCVSVAPDGGNGGHGGNTSGGASNGGTGNVGTGNGGASNAGAAGESTAGAAGSAPTVVDDGTAIGTLNSPCTKNGSLACAGHAQRSQLLCQGGEWHSNGACAGSNLCDSTPGTNAGSCQPIVAECAGQVAGFHFCRATETDVRQCGLDLVTADVTQTCPFVCTDGACKGECHPGSVDCKAGNLIPQLCDMNGILQDQKACGYQCDPTSGKCIAASCKDGHLNGDETDTDCGGSCSGCPVNGACLVNGDCVAPASAHCAGGKCAAASCSDGVKNGSETDIDCGGSCPKACAVNAGCSLNSDCVLPGSGHCSGGTCQTETCGDGVKNGNETDIDCGGSCPADCAVNAGCVGDTDCVSVACLNAKCVTCKPTTKQCVSASVETCAADGTWGNPVLCTVANGTASCAAGACGVASCSAGFGNCNGTVSDGCETSLNVASACGTTCANRITCSTVNGTPSCPSGACVEACTPGYGDCGGTNDGCETNLNTVSNCGTCTHSSTCNAPAQMCSAGMCVANTPHTVGQASSSGWVDFVPSSDLWYVVPVSVAKDATVQMLEINGRTAGGLARMALWADDGAGHPGAFLAQTANISLFVGTNASSPVPKAPATVTLVTGGKTYWVGAKFTGAADVFQNSSTGAVAYDVGQAFGSLPSALDPFPSGSASVQSGVIYNFYLLVQDVPP